MTVRLRDLIYAKQGNPILSVSQLRHQAAQRVVLLLQSDA